MTTLIVDFVSRYADSDPTRMHMPGHKGIGAAEARDLTEISGADELFHPTGIIAESEQNASALFGCRTLYSAEGSSLCIRAMLYLAVRAAAERGQAPVIMAARNVHKAYLTAAVLLDFETVWLPPGAHYLSAAVTPDALESTYARAQNKPCALYLTSPDYLGNLSDIALAAAFCKQHDMLLLVDNAHGAYLQFLPAPCHPIALGADLCCDSAHKTLPVLTGGAYLHIADGAPAVCREAAKSAMALFASTSPSWLILQSLDRCNALLESEFPAQIRDFLPLLRDMKQRLTEAGWTLCGDEPMKLTLMPKSRGYTGTELSGILEKARIYVEFADADVLVMMPAPCQTEAELLRVTDVLCALPQRAPVTECPPPTAEPVFACTPRQAMLAPHETLPLPQCIGRICAEIALSCPPAVPVIICGEVITMQAANALHYYKTETCTVVAAAQF